MKRTITCMIAAATCAAAGAQGLGFKYDNKGLAVAYPVKVAEFDSILNWNVKTEILAFAGSRIEDGRILGGGAWVVPFRIAKPSSSSGIALFGYIGLGAEFVDGVPERLGVVFGVRF